MSRRLPKKKQSQKSKIVLPILFVLATLLLAITYFNRNNNPLEDKAPPPVITTNTPSIDTNPIDSIISSVKPTQNIDLEKATPTKDLKITYKASLRLLGKTTITGEFYNTSHLYNYKLPTLKIEYLNKKHNVLSTVEEVWSNIDLTTNTVKDYSKRVASPKGTRHVRITIIEATAY